MTSDQRTHPADQRRATGCNSATRVTKTLLGYGVIAGPFYLVVSLAQATTRDGFDPSRHEWSLLANGALGWIQIANLLVTGAMTLAAAAGMARATGRRPGGAWAARLLGVFGAGMVLAGVFLADPSDGFPPGTPAGRNQDISWHGGLHLLSAGVGFLAMVASCFVLAGWFSRLGQPLWARCSWVTGLIFLAGFGGVAAGAGNRAVNIAFTGAVILGWFWISAVSLHLYRCQPACSETDESAAATT